MWVEIPTTLKPYFLKGLSVMGLTKKEAIIKTELASSGMEAYISKDEQTAVIVFEENGLLKYEAYVNDPTAKATFETYLSDYQIPITSIIEGATTANFMNTAITDGGGSGGGSFDTFLLPLVHHVTASADSGYADPNYPNGIYWDLGVGDIASDNLETQFTLSLEYNSAVINGLQPSQIYFDATVDATVGGESEGEDGTLLFMVAVSSPANTVVTLNAGGYDGGDGSVLNRWISLLDLATQQPVTASGLHLVSLTGSLTGYAEVSNIIIKDIFLK